MDRTPRFVAVCGAALMFTGFGVGSVAYAATGAFGYTHTSDDKHRTLSDPESDSCIDVDESAYQARNGTNHTVVLYRTSGCDGESLSLEAGADDDTEFHFHSMKFSSS